ncbi:hypothetical protein ACHAWX_002174 [Stephanocyclus meneghinianus]
MIISNAASRTRPIFLSRVTLVVTVAVAFLFLLDADEILKYSRLLSPLSGTRGTVLQSSTCPGCRGIFRPEYDYEANYKKWDKLYGKTKSIILLGERHSGTNWITDHLVQCFSADVPVRTDYARFKHWFQSEDPSRVPPKSAIVLSMFRDPYDWVWAMKERPHHAHDHMDLPWLRFVTKPWVGNSYQRGEVDRNITRTGQKWNVTCLEKYSFVDIIPCSPNDTLHVYNEGYGDFKYELMHDGSERPYPSIVNLRKDKIENHLLVSKLDGTRAYYPFRYEDLYANGTEVLLNLVERATGYKRKCNAVAPMGKTDHKIVPGDYVNWMNRFVDWDVEALIGYSKR